MTEPQWLSLARALGRPGLIEDPRFVDARARKRNEEALYDLVAAWTRSRSPESAMMQLQGAGVPAGVVRFAQNLVDDPQLQFREYFVWAAGVQDSMRIYPLAAFTLDGERPGVRSPAPTLGEHSEQVLRDLLDLSDEELSALRRQAIIGTTPII